MLTLAAVVIFDGFGIYVAYQNSYTGMLKKGTVQLMRKNIWRQKNISIVRS